MLISYETFSFCMKVCKPSLLTGLLDINLHNTLNTILVGLFIWKSASWLASGVSENHKVAWKTFKLCPSVVEPAQKLCRCDNRPCLVFCPPTPVQRFTLLYPLIFSLGDGIPSWHSHFPATSFQQLQMPKLTGIVFWEQKCLREFRVKQPVKILTLAHQQVPHYSILFIPPTKLSDIMRVV